MLARGVKEDLLNRKTYPILRKEIFNISKDLVLP